MKAKQERIAIVAGLRSPMVKAGGELKDTTADDLGAFVLRALIDRMPVEASEIDEAVIGNVAQPSKAANVGRVIALKAGLPQAVPASTVHRNCASGMEALSTAAEKIRAGSADICVVGGVESMSGIPLLFSKKYTDWASGMQRAKTFGQRLGNLGSFRWNMLSPEIGLMQGLTDPVSGMIMGITAEVLSRDFHITREEQDSFALESHKRAVNAWKEGRFADEVVPIPSLPKWDAYIEKDIGPREQQTMEALAKLKPYFDRRNGTVTAGNASQITDGAAFMLVMSESEAKKRKLEVLGYLNSWAYAGLEPERMGLGPAYATAKLFKNTGVTLKDIDYIEMNEAFAAQVIANERAFASDSYCIEHFGLSKAMGTIDRAQMNRNGGAIALGHPVGMTGARIVIHVLRELKRTNKSTGLATLCVGGGQGASFLLESA